MSAIPKPKRLALIALGAVLIVLFAGYAIARGIGNPDVPAGDVAVVEDAPAGLSPISESQFDRALQQTAARSGVEEVPNPGSARYEELKQGAMNDLLDQVWIQSEAADLGITATADEVSQLLQQTIEQNFRDRAEFERFRRESHFSQEEIRTRIRLQIFSNKLQQEVLGQVANVSDAQISEYYEEAKSTQFVQPATRDVRLVLNKDQAEVEQAKQRLEVDSSNASWEKVASEFSTEPSSKNNGGLRSSLTEGLLEQPLDREVFGAPQGQVEGPVRTPLGYYVFEVVKVTPERTLPLNRTTRAQIRSQLTQQTQQNAFSAFVDDFGSKWRARTFCAPGFVIERCNNSVGGAPPANAPAGCYEANPEGGRPEACPAPVQSFTPALPGTTSLVSPQGIRLPQRPVPVPTGGAAGGLPGTLAPPPGGTPTAP